MPYHTIQLFLSFCINWTGTGKCVLWHPFHCDIVCVGTYVHAQMLTLNLCVSLLGPLSALASSTAFTAVVASLPTCHLLSFFLEKLTMVVVIWSTLCPVDTPLVASQEGNILLTIRASRTQFEYCSCFRMPPNSHFYFLPK